MIKMIVPTRSQLNEKIVAALFAAIIEVASDTNKLKELVTYNRLTVKSGDGREFFEVTMRFYYERTKDHYVIHSWVKHYPRSVKKTSVTVYVAQHISHAEKAYEMSEQSSVLIAYELKQAYIELRSAAEHAMRVIELQKRLGK